jgi:hypothetical protein
MKESEKKLTYLWIQWADERTQYLWINTPPHQWPMKPSDGCNNSKLACHPNSPSYVGKPYIILGFLDTVDVMLLCLSPIFGSTIIHGYHSEENWKVYKS